MSAGRPFEPRVVVLASPRSLTDGAGWARRWTEAGADGLALEADPGDPLAADWLAALRRETPLPLEVPTPVAAVPRPEWAEVLADCEVDWLLPAMPPDEATAGALAEVAMPWAWPLAGGNAPAEASRLHARGTMAPVDWSSYPEGAERSLGPDPGKGAPLFGDCGADTLILSDSLLEGIDPAAALAGLRL